MYDGVIDDLGFDAADVKAQTDGWVQTMKVRNALHFVSRQFRMYKTMARDEKSTVRKTQNKERVSLTGAASRGYRSRWLVLGMVRRHPSFCVTILIDPKNPGGLSFHRIQPSIMI